MTTFTAETLSGQTVHALRGSKYFGEWRDVEVRETQNYKGHENVFLAADGRCAWHALTDLFPTEEAARAEAKARRRPRTVKVPQPLYGDFALLAQFHGLRTDGTGRRA